MGRGRAHSIIGAAALAATVAAGAALTGCRHVDNKRTPPADVWIAFVTPDMWNTYGVPGAMDTRRFVLNANPVEPKGFPYTALMRTGYGGVLLVADIHGNPVAYDLSCPVENKPDIRVNVDPDTRTAVCSRCHSSYEIFTSYGNAVSGPALEYAYGLTLYYCGPGRNGEYRVISR